MALLGDVGNRTDPVLGFNFLISLVDSSSSVALALSANPAGIAENAVGGFNECTGLEANLETEDYREGGLNGFVHRFPTRVTWTNITLRKGIRKDTDLWNWHYAFVEGRVVRRDGVIVLLDELHQPHTTWYFRRGLPVKYSAPSLNAQQDNVAIEALEIAHEGLFQL